MADWVSITDSQVDPDAPLTSELAYAWRDNHIAVAEGAPGAPRVQLRGMASPNAVMLSIAGTTYSALTGLDGIAGLGIELVSGPDTAATSLQIGYANDGGATYSSDYALNVASVSGNTFVAFYNVNIQSGVWSGVGLRSGTTSSIASNNGTHNGKPSNVNAVRFRFASARNAAIIVTPLGGY